MTWQNLRARCSDTKSADYASYGGRGITVCSRWLNSYENFIADMGKKPRPGMSIDRIDNDGPYSPENCRWADAITQASNKRTTRVISAFGLSMTMAKWAREMGCSQSKLFIRKKLGWSDEKTVAEWSPWGEAFAPSVGEAR